MPRSAARPLKVAIDYTIFNYQGRGGISRYFVKLAEHLPAHGIAPKIMAPLYVNESLHETRRGLFWGRKVRPSLRQEYWGKQIARVLHTPMMMLHGARIVHESYYHWEDSSLPSVAKVLTIYDMIFEFNPDIPDAEFQIRVKKAALARADRILCISESARRDLLHFYPQYADRTSVVLLGFDSIFADPGTGASPHPRPYILYVGMRRDYKNFIGLVAAFAASSRLREAFDLICIGGGAFNDAERRLLHDAGMADRCLQREADDRQLSAWYRHAVLFAYPSLYEGFGIPPLEAMAANCPVVCMNTSSIPEVCGDAAQYAELDRPDSLVAALEAVAFSPSRADALRRAGRARTTMFSWDACARGTAEVYRELA